MDLITQSLLDEFSTEQEITSLPEDTRFEHFASYVTVRRQYGETFDPADTLRRPLCWPKTNTLI